MTQSVAGLRVETLREWFGRFNREYFSAALPMPRLALSRSRTRLGSMSCKRERRLTGERLTDFAIHVSTYYDMTAEEYQTVLLHEMIHYHIAYHSIRDTAPHGAVFRRMMHELNSKHGWNITVSSSVRGKQVSPHARPDRARLVLALENRDGHCFLTVVNPRYARQMKLELERVKEVTTRAWFVSGDHYFADFATVRTLRARKVSRPLFEEKVAAGKMIDM